MIFRPMCWLIGSIRTLTTGVNIQGHEYYERNDERFECELCGYVAEATKGSSLPKAAGVMVVKEFHTKVEFTSKNGEQLLILADNDGFEFIYNGVIYSARGNIVEKENKNDI